MSTTAALPYVSVVIPVLNCADEVEACVAALRGQDYPADRHEIVVVDNGSTDGTPAALERSGVRWFVRKERGRARALNTGIQHARGEIICTTDISCRPAADWLSVVVREFLDDPRVGCVAGDIKQLKTGDNAVLAFQARSNYMSPLLALGRTRLPFMPFADGANASFRRRLFDEIGGFEEGFSKGADVEICYRMFVLSDYKLVFHPGAVVWEPGEPDLTALLKQRFRMGLGWNLMRAKYPALYALNEPARGGRRRYWRLRAAAAELATLAALNARALAGGDRAAASDATIRYLMGLAQAWGRVYGRWYLDRHPPGVPPVDAAALARFLATGEQVMARVVVR